MPPSPCTYTACDYSDRIRPTVTISPYEGIPGSVNKPAFYYPEGMDIRINCTMSPVYYSIKPHWYLTRNCTDGAQMKLLGLPGDPDYYVEHSRGECSWSTVLTIRNFSQALAGNYYCGSCPSDFANQTVSMEGKPSM